MINAESYRKLNIPKCRDTLFKGNNFGIKVIESELNVIVTKSRMKPSIESLWGVVVNNVHTLLITGVYIQTVAWIEAIFYSNINMSDNLCWCPVHNNTCICDVFKNHLITIGSWTSSHDWVNCVFLLMKILNITNRKKTIILRGMLIHIMKCVCFLEVVQVLAMVQKTKTWILRNQITTVLHFHSIINTILLYMYRQVETNNQF